LENKTLRILLFVLSVILKKDNIYEVSTVSNTMFKILENSI